MVKYISEMNISVKSSFIGVAIVFTYFMLNNFNVKAMHIEESLELLFRQRTNSDWKDVWHSETHSRCRNKLIRQLYWACEKDIYRLTRSNRKRIDESIYNRTHLFLPNWLNSALSQTLLKTRRSSAHSITAECCTKAGCTWEEYAEYCPSNRRRNHY